MLNKLGGKKGNIDILLIEIKRWYKSSRSMVQIIDNNIVQNQPFQQIIIYYQCNMNQTMERLVLAKYLKYQERSSCPTQITITPHEDFFTPHREIFKKPIDINFDQKFYLNKSNIILNSSNDSNIDYNKKIKSNKWSLFVKVCLQILYFL